MSHYLLELKIAQISFEAEELHLILKNREKVFSIPSPAYSIDIQSTTSLIIFEFHLKSKVVFQGKLNPSVKFSTFTEENQKRVEFHSDIKELFHPKMENPQDCLVKLKNTIKPCLSPKQIFDYSEDFDFTSVFQDNFLDHSEGQYVNYLESVIVGLVNKVKSYQYSVGYKENASGFMGKAAENNKNSNEFMSYSTNNNENEETQKQLEALKRTNSELVAQCKSQTGASEKLSIENKLLSSEIIKLKSESRNFDLISRNLKEIQGLLTEKDKSIESLKEKLKTLNREQENLLNAFETNSQDAISENQKLVKDLQKANEKIRDFEAKQEKISNENFQLQQELIREKTCFKNIEKITKSENPQKISLVTKDLLRQIEDLTKVNKEVTIQFQQENQKMINKCKELETRLMCKQKADLRQTCYELRSKFPQSPGKSSNSLFDNLLKESQSSFEFIKNIDYKSTFENSSIYEHSEKLSSKLLEYSKTIYYYQGIINRLVEIMRELKSENFALRERLFFSQNAFPLYIPVRGDPLDFAMAEFVNNLKRPLRIPFVRQDPGFYLFGTRNIRIKILNSKPYIYAPEPAMPIDDFVAKYTKGELIKFEEHKRKEEQRMALDVSKIPFNESVFSTNPLTPSASSSMFSNHRSNSNKNSVDSPDKNFPSSTKASHSRKSSYALSSRVFKKQ